MGQKYAFIFELKFENMEPEKLSIGAMVKEKALEKLFETYKDSGIWLGFEFIEAIPLID